eukprot:2692196-Alexandrium_andersonii.AAC.1
MDPPASPWASLPLVVELDADGTTIRRVPRQLLAIALALPLDALLLALLLVLGFTLHALHALLRV